MCIICVNSYFLLFNLTCLSWNGYANWLISSMLVILWKKKRIRGNWCYSCSYASYLAHIHACNEDEDDERSNKNELILKFHFLFLPVAVAHSGLLDTITSTENSKDCPGVCVHALATLICYDVLEEVKCPSSGMKCCVESSSGKKWK